MGLRKTWYCDAASCGEFSESPHPAGWHLNAVHIDVHTKEFGQLWFCSREHLIEFFTP